MMHSLLGLFTFLRRDPFGNFLRFVSSPSPPSPGNGSPIKYITIVISSRIGAKAHGKCQCKWHDMTACGEKRGSRVLHSTPKSQGFDGFLSFCVSGNCGRFLGEWSDKMRDAKPKTSAISRAATWLKAYFHDVCRHGIVPCFLERRILSSFRSCASCGEFQAMSILLGRTPFAIRGSISGAGMERADWIRFSLDRWLFIGHDGTLCIS